MRQESPRSIFGFVVATLRGTDADGGRIEGCPIEMERALNSSSIASAQTFEGITARKGKPSLNVHSASPPNRKDYCISSLSDEMRAYVLFLCY